MCNKIREMIEIRLTPLSSKSDVSGCLLFCFHPLSPNLVCTGTSIFVCSKIGQFHENVSTNRYQTLLSFYGIVSRTPQRTKRPSDCKIQWHEVKYPEQRSKSKTDARNCDCAEVTRSRFCVVLLGDNFTEDLAGEQLFQNGDSRVRIFHHAVFHPIEQHTGHSMRIKS